MSAGLNRPASSAPKVCLITGAGGYVGLNVVQAFANEKNFRIRASVRSLNDKKKLEAIQKAAKQSKYPVEFVVADLLQADSWGDALKGVNIVLHVASPYPNETPKDVEKELLKPAVDGTLNVLNAAFKAGVERVVLTSSCAAIFTFTIPNRNYTEADWPDVDKCAPYAKSKVLAEKAAWDFVESKKKNNEKVFDLVVLNPAIVHGPSLGGSDTLGTSELGLARLLEGKPEQVNQFFCGHCDVRDLALAHVRGALLPEAVGHRHIIVSEKPWFSQARSIEIMREEFGPKGYKLPQVVPAEDPNVTADNSRLINVLGITPTNYKNTVIDMANSLIEAGVVKK